VYRLFGVSQKMTRHHNKKPLKILAQRWKKRKNPSSVLWKLRITKEREVCAVPESWIKEIFLAWPSHNKKKSSLIQGKVAPQNDWRREKFIILKHGIRKFEAE
jgi:hypothetical protein